MFVSLLQAPSLLERSELEGSSTDNRLLGKTWRQGRDCLLTLFPRFKFARGALFAVSSNDVNDSRMQATIDKMKTKSNLRTHQED